MLKRSSLGTNGAGPQKRRRVGRTLLVGAGIAFSVLAANAIYPSFLTRTELQLLDQRLRARPLRKPVGVVAVAAIDDNSLKKLGQWPWPRALIARLVSALADYKAAVIGFDMVFSEPDGYDHQRDEILIRLKARHITDGDGRALLGPANDASLAAALRAQGSAIMGFPFASHHLIRNNERYPMAGFLKQIVPPPPIEYGLVRRAPGPAPAVPIAFGYLPGIPIINNAVRGSAFFDINSDPDAMIRTQMMVIRFWGHYYVPLTLAMVWLYRHRPLLSLDLDDYGVTAISIGAEKIPVDEIGQMLISYRGGGNTFPAYSAVNLMEHRVPARELAGKVVLIGVTARGLGDRVSTPFDDDSPGVQVHATVIDNLIAGDFLHRSLLNELFARLAACMMGLAVTLAFAFLSERQSAAAAGLIALGYLFFTHLVLVYNGLVLNLGVPLITLGITYTGLAGYRYATEGIEKRRLRLAFEHYLHPQVIESILDHSDSVKLGGELRHLSILFADIVNYTSRAERERPEDLVALLNSYMTAMTDLILTSGGVVDKIRGDGVMAFWGAPVKVSNPSRLALDCGLAMLEELNRLRVRDPRFTDIDIGVGIATGEAVVGNFGGERRFDYSAIGDVVNLASRFESLTRQFKAHLLVTKEAYEEAGALYVARWVGLVKVKGKSQAAGMVEIIGRKDGSSGTSYYDRFEQAMKVARDGDPREGLSMFEQLLKEKPSDHVLEMYLERGRANPAVFRQEMVFEFDVK